MHEHKENAVYLLPEFSCSFNGRKVGSDETSGKLIIYLALEAGGLSRGAAAARLWPDVDPRNSAKRLRQLLWRIRQEARSMITVSTDSLRLTEDAIVDYRAAKTLAQDVLRTDPLDLREVDPLIVRLLSTELLREVYDEEVLGERDRWDRLRLLALERLAKASLDFGDATSAIVLATLAAQVDELAEDPQRLLTEAHLRRGDTVSAYRSYLDYAKVLRRELGVEPGPSLQELVTEIRS